MSSSPTVVAEFNPVCLRRRSLIEVFAQVPDPRDPRGVRHSVSTVLLITQAAVTAGVRTLLAISEWSRDVGRDVLAQPGIDPSVTLPSESTIRRTLARLDADDLDARLGSWMATRVGDLGGRQVIAVDGKSMRGVTGPDGKMPHLLAALHHDTGVVAGQLAVAAKSNEIPALPVLLDQLDLAEVVVTADALHCQRRTAGYITGAGGHYVLTVRATSPHCAPPSQICPGKKYQQPRPRPLPMGAEYAARSKP